MSATPPRTNGRINGLGDLHMRAMLEKMQKQYNLEIIKPPKIYRETIMARQMGIVYKEPTLSR